MAKTSYLDLTNKVLRRVSQDAISDTATATGKALIVTNAINEAQIELFNEMNWYSLYATRTFNTAASTSSYAVASDFGRTIVLTDTANNRTLVEDVTRAIAETDPDQDTTGAPTHFAFEGVQYRLWPIPDGIFSITDQYWKIPTVLSANSDTSILPIECDNLLWSMALLEILEYMNKYEQADRLRARIYGNNVNNDGMLERAKRANRKIINKMTVFQPGHTVELPLEPPRFGAGYPRRTF